MLHFIDSNCVIGFPLAPHEFKVCVPADVERISRNCGITTAFAYHQATYDLHPVDGNHAVDTVCKNSSFFRPVWVVMPNDTGEFYEPQELVCKMKKQKVQMSRVFPKYNDHSFSMAGWSAGPLLKALAENSIPLLIDADQIDLEFFHDLMMSNPELTVIITNIYYRQGRVLISLLKRHKNLYCETSGFRSFCMLQAFCEAGLSKQLVFGTGMGLYSAGSAVAIITYAGIAPVEKETIAYGNICRILRTDVKNL